MRLTKEQLEEVKRKYGVNELYSWSKVNCFMTSPYEFYLKYILNKKEDIDNCAYAPLGGIAHQCIEDFYSKKIEYKDMIENFEDGWVTAIDVADLKFDRNDDEKNNNIKKKYKENLQHFFTHHKIIEKKIELERFLSAKIGDYVLQGYADAITKDEDGNFVIIDWKTSSEYKGKTLEEHSGQLTVYAIALMQLGIPLEKIRCAFNFLKYCNVLVTQKNGKQKIRSIERHKLGESLMASAKTWLKASGYDEDEVDDYLKQLIDTNGIECLPKEVQEKFDVSDRYVYIDLNESLINKWIKEIISAIKDIELRKNDYDKTHNEKIWWDNEESLKTQSYYFATLCGYSRNLHKPYNNFCNKLDEQKNGTNLFGGLLNDSDDSNCSNIAIENNNNLDLSWLEGI